MAMSTVLAENNKSSSDCILSTLEHSEFGNFESGNHLASASRFWTTQNDANFYRPNLNASEDCSFSTTDSKYIPAHIEAHSSDNNSYRLDALNSNVTSPSTSASNPYPSPFPTSDKHFISPNKGHFSIPLKSLSTSVKTPARYTTAASTTTTIPQVPQSANNYTTTVDSGPPTSGHESHPPPPAGPLYGFSAAPFLSHHKSSSSHFALNSHDLAASSTTQFNHSKAGAANELIKAVPCDSSTAIHPRLPEPENRPHQSPQPHVRHFPSTNLDSVVRNNDTNAAIQHLIASTQRHLLQQKSKSHSALLPTQGVQQPMTLPLSTPPFAAWQKVPISSPYNGTPADFTAADCDGKLYLLVFDKGLNSVQPSLPATTAGHQTPVLKLYAWDDDTNSFGQEYPNDGTNMTTAPFNNSNNNASTPKPLPQLSSVVSTPTLPSTLTGASSSTPSSQSRIRGNMPPACGGYRSFSFNGCFCIIGGRDRELGTSDFHNLWQYNPTKNAWTSHTIRTPDGWNYRRETHSTTVVGNRIFIFAGVCPSAIKWEFQNDLWEVSLEPLITSFATSQTTQDTNCVPTSTACSQIDDENINTTLTSDDSSRGQYSQFSSSSFDHVVSGFSGARDTSVVAISSQPPPPPRTRTKQQDKMEKMTISTHDVDPSVGLKSVLQWRPVVVRHGGSGSLLAAAAVEAGSNSDTGRESPATTTSSSGDKVEKVVTVGTHEKNVCSTSQSSAPDWPRKRAAHAACCWSSRLWVFGGSCVDGCVGEALKDFWEYSPTTETWSEIVDACGIAPRPRYGHTCTVVQNQMIVFGGFSLSNNFPLNDLHEFSFIDKTWNMIVVRSEEWPLPRFRHDATTHGGCFWLFGGRSTVGSALTASSGSNLNKNGVQSARPVTDIYRTLMNRRYHPVTDLPQDGAGCSAWRRIDTSEMTDLMKDAAITSLRKNLFAHELHLTELNRSSSEDELLLAAYVVLVASLAQRVATEEEIVSEVAAQNFRKDLMISEIKEIIQKLPPEFFSSTSVCSETQHGNISPDYDTNTLFRSCSDKHIPSSSCCQFRPPFSPSSSTSVDAAVQFFRDDSKPISSSLRHHATCPTNTSNYNNSLFAMNSEPGRQHRQVLVDGVPPSSLHSGEIVSLPNNFTQKKANNNLITNASFIEMENDGDVHFANKQQHLPRQSSLDSSPHAIVSSRNSGSSIPLYHRHSSGVAGCSPKFSTASANETNYQYKPQQPEVLLSRRSKDSYRSNQHVASYISVESGQKEFDTGPHESSKSDEALFNEDVQNNMSLQQLMQSKFSNSDLRMGNCKTTGTTDNSIYNYGIEGGGRHQDRRVHSPSISSTLHGVESQQLKLRYMQNPLPLQDSLQQHNSSSDLTTWRRAASANINFSPQKFSNYLLSPQLASTTAASSSSPRTANKPIDSYSPVDAATSFDSTVTTGTAANNAQGNTRVGFGGAGLNGSSSSASALQPHSRQLLLLLNANNNDHPSLGGEAKARDDEQCEEDHLLTVATQNYSAAYRNISEHLTHKSDGSIDFDLSQTSNSSLPQRLLNNNQNGETTEPFASLLLRQFHYKKPSSTSSYSSSKQQFPHQPQQSQQSHKTSANSPLISTASTTANIITHNSNTNNSQPPLSATSKVNKNSDNIIESFGQLQPRASGNYISQSTALPNTVHQ